MTGIKSGLVSMTTIFPSPGRCFSISPVMVPTPGPYSTTNLVLSHSILRIKSLIR